MIVLVAVAFAVGGEVGNCCDDAISMNELNEMNGFPSARSYSTSRAGEVRYELCHPHVTAL